MFMTAAATLTILSAPLPVQARTLSVHEIAVIEMADKPAEAEKVLRQAKNPTEELDYALFLHAFRSHTAKTKAKITRLTDDIRAAIAAKGDFWGKAEIGEITPYDGSDKSLIPLLQAASMSSAGQTYSAFYAIPCGVLEKRPALLDATAPMYGGNGDNFLPRSGCGWTGHGTTAGYPDKLVQTYAELADRADGCIACGTGTIRFTQESQEALARERMRLDPRWFLTRKNQFTRPTQAYPYQVWSYSSLSNRRLGRKIEAAYEQARRRLASYYQTKGLSQAEASIAAMRALFSVSFGANCGNGPLRTSLRTLVLDNASEATIEAYLRSHKDYDIAQDPVADCARFGGLDPMAHIALVRPNIFALLARTAGEMPDSERKHRDLQMDVNQPNDFGKTPLMTAAQFGLAGSARYLISHGAEVNAALPKGGTLHAAGRTALHYAAASGSLSMVRLLIAHGADIHAKDAVGVDSTYFGVKNTPGQQTPLDYFNGEGPMPAPKSFSARDKAEIVHALGG
jgi:hypothetical protein